MEVETTKLSQEEIVRLATEKQLILNPDAIPLLSEYSDYYTDFLNEFSKENVFSISKEMVEKKIGEKKSKLGKVLEVEVIDRKFVPIAKDTSSNYKILEDMNITTEKSAGGNKSIDFVKLFQEKFAFISECFKKRGFNPKNSFSVLEKLPRNQEVELIGMVSEKWESKNGNLCLRVEDLESDIIVIFMKNNQQFYEKAKRILFDDVILIKGKKATEGMVIADQFHWPELPLRKSKTIDEDLSVLVSSDIHVGSRLFLEKEFSNFIDWMNGKGLSEKERQAVGKIKYMTIIGDCIAEYEEIFTKDGVKKAKEIKVGNLVLSYDFNKKKFVYKPISKVWDRGIKDIYRVHFRNGQWIDVTDEHNFLVRSSESNSKGYMKKQLKEIDLNDIWRRRVPIAQKIPYKIIDEKWLNEDLCFVLGHFLAEGWVEGGHVATSGYEAPEQIIPLLEKNNIPFSERANGNGVPMVYFLKGHFKDFLKETKKNSFNIHLPEYIFNLPPQKLEKILAGYYLGDGNDGNFPDKRGYNSSKSACYSTSSEQFARDIQRIGLQLGRTFHIWKQEKHNGAGKKPIYRITYNPKSHFLKNYDYAKIGEVSISYIEKIKSCQTYDWEVKDTHNFVFKNGIITHNCVDGIGVYPSQISELNVRDIFEQYKILEDYLLQIPEHVEVFIIPGNHDATRWADPQLPLDNKFLPRASKMSNIHLLSSPAWLEIEGLITTLYHGGGLFGVMGALNMNTMKPADAIQELLIRRDLMAMYGTKHPYVPEKTNYMLVREVPDLYFGGDNHHNDYGNYRGTTIINNGCWQDQTAYATQLGHIVTPCRVPIYNMKTAKIREVNFTQPNINEREMGVQG